MTLTAENLRQVASAMADRGVYSISVREVEGGADIEIRDPLLTLAEVAGITGYSAPTIRRMEKLGILHAVKSKGISGDLRFQQSRLYADLRNAADLKKRNQRG